MLVAAGLYAVLATLFSVLAQEVEAEGRAYPYKSEDWLRYLLPSFFAEGGAPRILLTGPSTARENLVYDMFDEAFPGYRTLQGGISLGTLQDVLLSLEYVRAVHGRRALPAMIVLGISPRFLAEIPRQRPFALGLDRYSPAYEVVDSAGHLDLSPKSPWEGAVSRLRFAVGKQTPRRQVAALSLMHRLLPRDADERLRGSFVAGLLSRVGAEGLVEVGPRARIEYLISPYKYRLSPPMPVEGLRGWLDDPGSWWRDVYRWDPAGADTHAIRVRFRRLRALAREHGIELYVANLPEREVSRARYDPEHYRAYLALIRDAVGDAPFLDIRTMLDDDEFYDAEHATGPGAARVTDSVIAFIRRARADGCPASCGAGSAR